MPKTSSRLKLALLALTAASSSIVIASAAVNYNPLLALAAFFLAAIWFFISLHPDSFLGFAVTGSEWGPVFRRAFDSMPEDRDALHAAANRSFCFHSAALALFALAAFVHNRDFMTQVTTIPVFLGLLAGYLAILLVAPGPIESNKV